MITIDLWLKVAISAEIQLVNLGEGSQISGKQGKNADEIFRRNR
ncbi:hypothetical protein MgSA37_04089 [Mucilaginibacter gotjawali]|uniref:Uncharacterized protein n=2 Tax=Mucilaginibacter gotjawali TaxID=1550579 RepID=A0A0X8X566_9SPHI|nr:hypothetical protein [Mucilaginibacter gotjawali]BAU55897.1 hypothetical protein MgSA37_04089 [Mucilaginibacter gotjawali]